MKIIFKKFEALAKVRQKWLIKTAVLMAVFSSHAGTTYDLNKSVIASGGETAGGQYQLKSAVGQNVTTKSASSTYRITAGFFQENRDLIFVNEFENNQ